MILAAPSVISSGVLTGVGASPRQGTAVSVMSAPPALGSPENPWRSPAAWTGAVFLLAYLALALLLWRRRAKPYCGPAAFALGWILLTLLPVLGILPIDAVVCERFLYVPLVGMAALWALAWDGLPRNGRAFGRAALAALALVFAGLSLARIPAWSDDLALWRAAALAEPANAFAHACRAEAAAQRGFLREAVGEYDAALAGGPSTDIAFAALVNLADLHNRLGEAGLSLTRSRQALELRPGSFPPLRHRIESYMLLKKRREALEWTARAESLYPAGADWTELKRRIRAL